MTKKTPYPYQPLTHWLKQTNIRNIANRLGKEPKTIIKILQRAKRTEGLTEAQADQLAIACNTHPNTVWGNLWNQNYRPD